VRDATRITRAAPLIEREKVTEPRRGRLAPTTACRWGGSNVTFTEKLKDQGGVKVKVNPIHSCEG
jgi:hypothetical protein